MTMELALRLRLASGFAIEPFQLLISSRGSVGSIPRREVPWNIPTSCERE